MTFSEVTEPERLLALTRRALAEASQPKVSYKVDVAALDGDDAAPGDTVAVIDTSRDPEWRLTARVVRRVRTFGEQVGWFLGIAGCLLLMLMLLPLVPLLELYDDVRKGYEDD